MTFWLGGVGSAGEGLDGFDCLGGCEGFRDAVLPS